MVAEYSTALNSEKQPPLTACPLETTERLQQHYFLASNVLYTTLIGLDWIKNKICLCCHIKGKSLVHPFKILTLDCSCWHLTLSSVSEQGRFWVGDGENVKEQERNSQRLQPYSCEYRFGYSLPLGRLQQANYQASVTQRERQKHRLTEAKNTFQPQFQLQHQVHPVIRLPQNLTAPGPLLFSHFSASLQAPWFHKRLQAMSAAPEREEEKG